MGMDNKMLTSLCEDDDARVRIYCDGILSGYRNSLPAAVESVKMILEVVTLDINDSSAAKTLKEKEPFYIKSIEALFYGCHGNIDLNQQRDIYINWINAHPESWKTHFAMTLPRVYGTVDTGDVVCK